MYYRICDLSEDKYLTQEQLAKLLMSAKQLILVMNQEI